VQPFLDFKGRTLSLGGGISTPVACDALLRLQNSQDWERPITIYLGVSEPHDVPLSALDALQVSSLIGCLRVPVIRTVALGLLRGYEPLVLAAGSRGQRHLMAQALLFFGEPTADTLTFEMKVGGLNPRGQCPRDRLRQWCAVQTSKLLTEFGVKVGTWPSGQLLNPDQAIEMGFGDAIVPNRCPTLEPQCEKAQSNLNRQPMP
jgi:hypothetical protein